MSREDRLLRNRVGRWVIGSVAFGYLPSTVAMEAWRAVVFNGATLGIVISSWAVQRFLRADRAAAHLLLTSGLVAIFGAALGGGQNLSNGAWHLPLLTLGAGFLLSIRATAAWCVIAALATLLNAYLQEGMPIARDYPDAEVYVAVMRGFGIVVAAVFGYLNSVSTSSSVQDQREKMKAVQRATQRAERADAEKSDFLAKVSHELRTPMNGIMGMTQFLLSRPALPPEARAQAQTIHRSSTSLLRVFRDILDLSSIESGEARLKGEALDIVAVVHDLANLFAAKCNATSHQIRIVAPPVCHYWIMADATRLHQVLGNLMGNAIKFSDGGVIEVVLEIDEHPDAKEKSCTLRISVRDQGIGMSQAQAQALSSGVERPAVSAEADSGHGVSMTRELIERLGGELEVSSCIGEGSTFRVCLPVPKAAAQRSFVEPAANGPATAKASSGDSQLRVMVVDDLAINRKVAGLSLKRLGCRVDEAQDGVQAVELADKIAYDCIFMDLRMPNMDGFEATEVILAKSTCNRGTPIIALSASAFEEDKRRCMEVGMVEHVAKPFRSSDLGRVLNIHVSNYHPADGPSEQGIYAA